MSKKTDPILQGTTTMGERGQIVIPREIRAALGIRSGETLTVLSQGGKIVVLPSRRLEGFYQSLMGQVDKMRKHLRGK